MVLALFVLLLGSMCWASDISIQFGEISEVDSSTAVGFMDGISMDKRLWWELGNVKSEAFLRYLTPPGQNLLATKNAALATFTSAQNIDGLGTLKISGWMLGFLCMTTEQTSSCQTFSPVIVKNQLDASNNRCLQYSTAWKRLLSSNSRVIVNSIPAYLLKLNATDFQQQASKSLGQLEFWIRAMDDTESCQSAVLSARPASDAANNVGPYLCLESEADGTRLLALGYSNKSNSSQALQGTYGSPILQNQSMNEACIKKHFSIIRNVEDCQDAPLFISSKGGGVADDIEYLCLDPSQTVCNYLLLDCDCTWLKDRISKKSGAKTEASACFLQTVATDDIGLVYGQGYQAPDNSVNSNKVCEIVINKTRTSGAALSLDPTVDPNTLGIMFASVRQKYAQAHNNHVNLKSGPPADVLTAAIALLSAVIAVITATIPFTNFLLWSFVKLTIPLDLYRCLLLIPLNILITSISYLPLIGLVVTEFHREAKFRTWALLAETVLVNPAGQELQALHVLQGESVYDSMLIKLVLSMVAISLPVVGAITFFRCRSVLAKLNLLKLVGSASVPQVDELRAIEMGDSEYIHLSSHATAPVDDINPSATAPEPVNRKLTKSFLLSLSRFNMLYKKKP